MAPSSVLNGEKSENPFRSVSDRGEMRPPASNPNSSFPLHKYSLEYGHYVSSNSNGVNGGASAAGGNDGQIGYIPAHVFRVGHKPGNGFEYIGDPYGQYGGGSHGSGGGSSSTTTTMSSSSANPTDEPRVVIRGEEIGIVIMVLLLWLGAIVLFFHRWGKIRMLEPYQPKFMESHRLSCPMADVTGMPHGPRTYSKFNLSTDVVGSSPHFAKCNYHGVGVLGGSGGIGAIGSGPSAIAQQILTTTNRPRQNSVFVTSPLSCVAVTGSNLKSASRKTKSAIDLSTLVLSETFMENVRRNSKNSITHL